MALSRTNWIKHHNPSSAVSFPGQPGVEQKMIGKINSISTYTLTHQVHSKLSQCALKAADYRSCGWILFIECNCLHNNHNKHAV